LRQKRDVLWEKKQIFLSFLPENIHDALTIQTDEEEGRKCNTSECVAPWFCEITKQTV